MSQYNILWADDEIDLLKPYIMFLQSKGYDVTPVNSGADALEKIEERLFDVVFLDEMMPGLTGLETLAQLKQRKPNLPVVMITKSEEERIMEEAIGSKIADYLIKPLNPNQILLSVKKILDNKRLVEEKTNLSYQQEFRQLAMQYQDNLGHEEWAEIYKKLIYWELEIEQTPNKSMGEMLTMQKSEANSNFAKFIEDNYEDWLLPSSSIDKPLLSHQLMRKKVFPLLTKDPTPLFFLLIDNLRYDQWKVIEPLINDLFSIEEESHYYSILPTTTAFARNSIFSGLMPAEIEKQYPKMWVNDVGDGDEEGFNNHESDYLMMQVQRSRLNIKASYNKILNVNQGKNLVDNFNNLMQNQLNAVVYNFVDMVSHARTDMAMIKELAPDEAAYRSITRSWFEHSTIMDFVRKIADKKARLIITTDHGTIRVQKPVKIVGDRSVNTNLRYKQGRNLNWDDNNHTLTTRKPETFGLPKLNVSTAYVFATEDYFFAYPNNYNYYVNHYRDTFQHGGVSLEEIIIPFVSLKAK